jgi:hypothetical protein
MLLTKKQYDKLLHSVIAKFTKFALLLNKALPLLLNIILPVSIIIALVFLVKAVVILIKALRLNGYLNRANIILLALVFIFLGSIGVWTSTINSCSSCHLMRPEGQIWRKSSHRNISCYKCHRDPGAMSTVISKFRTVRMIAVTATDKFSKPMRSFVPDIRCLYCHKNILKGVNRSKNIKVRHKDFAGKIWKCVDCHIGVAHGAAVPLQNPPVMTRCVMCHDNRKASAKCGVCHTDDIQKTVKFKKWDPWQRAHGENGQKLHGTTDRTVCVVCHKRSFCSKCHIQMPHPASFKETHGKEAKLKDAKCMRCHSQNTCFSCHKLDLPHPKQFKVTHKTEVKNLGRRLCDGCHTERSCSDCHAYHEYHPEKGGKK